MRLRFTGPALADLDSIFEYIVARSPSGSRRVQARIKAVVDLLRMHPLIGTKTDDPVIRRMTTAPYPYSVFYEVGHDEIIVHAVRHDARDPSGMPGSGA